MIEVTEKAISPEAVIASVKQKVLDVCARFPVYTEKSTPAAMVAQG